MSLGEKVEEVKKAEEWPKHNTCLRNNDYECIYTMFGTPQTLPSKTNNKPTVQHKCYFTYVIDAKTI